VFIAKLVCGDFEYNPVMNNFIRWRSISTMSANVFGGLELHTHEACRLKKP